MSLTVFRRLLVPSEKPNTSINGNWGPLNWSIAVEGEKKKKKEFISYNSGERERLPNMLDVNISVSRGKCCTIGRVSCRP